MTVILQSILTGIVLYIVYLLFGPVNYVEVDTINEFFYLLFIPVGLIGITWILCFIAGLPIRLISSLNKWWKSKQLFVALTIITGLIILKITLKPDFAEPVFDITSPQDNSSTSVDWLATTHWFLTAFSLLHFYPRSFLQQIKKSVKNVFPSI